VTAGAAPSPGGPRSLPRAARITSAAEIKALLRGGKRRKTSHLDVFVSTSPFVYSRIGLIVPKPRMKTMPGGKRVRGAAVQRNRLKRRLREISRTAVLPALNARGCFVDVLVRARPEAYVATFAELGGELGAVQGWLCSSAG
jgi:ribonuclease P protein component